MPELTCKEHLQWAKDRALRQVTELAAYLREKDAAKEDA